MTLPDWVVLMTVGVCAAAFFAAGAGTVTMTVIGVGADASMTVAPGGAVSPGESWTYLIGRTSWTGVELGWESVVCDCWFCVAETGAASLKDMGKVMAALKERYTGSLDFGKAGGLIKAQLSGK